MVAKEGTKRVRFEGGPLDGQGRDIPAERVTWEPKGLTQVGVYKPVRPGSLRWKWEAK
jgi:hypothetical protein